MKWGGGFRAKRKNDGQREGRRTVVEEKHERQRGGEKGVEKKEESKRERERRSRGVG